MKKDLIRGAGDGQGLFPVKGYLGTGHGAFTVSRDRPFALDSS